MSQSFHEYIKALYLIKVLSLGMLQLICNMETIKVIRRFVVFACGDCEVHRVAFVGASWKTERNTSINP